MLLCRNALVTYGKWIILHLDAASSIHARQDGPLTSPPFRSSCSSSSAQYYIAFGRASRNKPPGTITTFSSSQRVKFTYDNAQPTAGILKRRMQAEVRGESVPYDVEQRCRQSGVGRGTRLQACHLGGRRWEVSGERGLPPAWESKCICSRGRKASFVGRRTASPRYWLGHGIILALVVVIINDSSAFQLSCSYSS